MEKLRQPIVTILGHVDHGKTTLLDAIRKTSFAKREAGGITQSIGASEVQTKEGKRITFIDTPGHAAFSKMRSQGAKVADIAVLVVAADDGVKPQTKEALTHILEAGIPYLVAVTKIDLPSASLETVKGQLEKEGVLFEGRGGDVPLVGVSGKTGEGVDELLEVINLMAEVNEIKADEKGSLEAVVIETSKDRRGSLVSVVVRNGTLRVRDEIKADGIVARVRGLFDWQQKPVKEVLPGQPALILGFSELPPVGSMISYSGVEVVLGERRRKVKEKRGSVKEEGQILLVVKSRNAGSLEAVMAGLPKEVSVVSSGVGEVSENDVFLAKASGAYIFTFGAKVSPAVSRLAATEGVRLESFDIIYKLFERLEELIEEGKRKILGRAQILASFPFDDKKIAGCRILQGKIKKNDLLILTRGEKEIGEVRVISLKKQKDEVNEVKEGEEFGVLFMPQLDFEKGDVLISVEK